MFDGMHGTPISGMPIHGGPISGRSRDWHNSGAYVSPSLEFEASSGVLPPGFTFSRASGATRINARGYHETVAADATRFNYDPALEYNQLLNPWFDGAVPGTPGLLGDTLFLPATVAGLTTRLVGRGVEGVIPYVDIGLVGTTNITGVTALAFLDSLSSAARARAGEQWTGTVYHRLISGDPIDGRLQLVSNTSGGAEIANTISNVADATTAPLATQAVGMTWTVQGATAEVIRFRYLINVTLGTPVDLVLRIGFPTLTRASSSILGRIPVETLAARVNGVPQYGLEGLLIERIPSNNGVRNPRGEGAVTQTYAPSLPIASVDVATNWRWPNRGSGLSIDVSPVAALGRTGLRVRWFGTTSASPGPETLEFELRNAAPAQTGVPITGSFELRRVAGTIPVAQLRARILTFTNGGTLVDNLAPLGAFPVDETIQTVFTTITPGAGVSTNGWATVGLILSGWPANTPVDFTLDIFCPQLETLPFPSSRILPPPGSPAATNRAADLPTIDQSLIDLVRSSIAMRFRAERPAGVVAPTDQVFFDARSSDGLGAVRLLAASGQNSARVRIARAGVVTDGVVAGPGAGGFLTAAVGWGPTTTDYAWDGGSVTTASTSPDRPASTLTVGAVGTGTFPANLTLQYLRIWRGRRLSAAQVEAQSARIT